MNTINVLLVDDHPPILEGYVAMLGREPDIHVVGAVQDGETALQYAQQAKPDVVLMDIEMRGMNGIEATRRLRDLCPDSRVLVVSAHDRREYILQALTAGAWDYVLKDLVAHQLMSAIRAAAHGERYMHPKVMPTLFPVAQEDGEDEVLTRREREVLHLVGTGLTNEEVAAALSITQSTVKNHMRAILQKLGVPSRFIAVQEAQRRGILP